MMLTQQILMFLLLTLFIGIGMGLFIGYLIWQSSSKSYTPATMFLYKDKTSPKFRNILNNYSDFLSKFQQHFLCKIVVPSIDCISYDPNVANINQMLATNCEAVKNYNLEPLIYNAIMSAYQNDGGDAMVHAFLTNYGIEMEPKKIRELFVDSTTRIIVSMFQYMCQGEKSVTVAEILTDIKMMLCPNASKEFRYIPGVCNA